MGIKSLELEPTEENILSTLEKNLLDRNESVWQFVRFCNAQEGKCSIALNAQWGYGKTFFVKQAKMLLEALNETNNKMTAEMKTKIKSAFNRYMGTGDKIVYIQPHFCVYYDAWSNDNDVDPILSLVYEIVRTTTGDCLLTKKRDVGKIIAALIESVTGKKVENILREVRGEDFLSKIKEQKGIHEIVKEFLDALIPEQGNRMVIFVDELDRCKPDFAVRFLERIKHYFSDERITFVFSVNLGELQHTIKRFYGEGFDAGRYLDRFFDYRVPLPPANMSRYYQEIGFDSAADVFENICKTVVDYYGFGIRELEKFYRTAKVATYDVIHTDSRAPVKNALTVGTYIFVPVMIGLMMTDSNLYYDFIKGKNATPLIDIIQDDDVTGGVCTLLLDDKEMFYGNTYGDGLVTVLLKDKLESAYKALFSKGDEGPWGENRVGKCIFDNMTRRAIHQIVSMLSKYASY